MIDHLREVAEALEWLQQVSIDPNSDKRSIFSGYPMMSTDYAFPTHRNKRRKS